MIDNHERYLISLVISSKRPASAIDVKAGDFELETHQMIWSCAEQLEATGLPANLITLSEKLLARNYPCPAISWDLHLGGIADAFSMVRVSDESVKASVDAMKTKVQHKRVIAIAQKLAQSPERAGDAIQALIDATAKDDKRRSTNLNSAVKKAVEQLGVYSRSHGLIGAKTGLDELDDILGGYQKSDFVVVGARSQMGKTAFALTCAENAVKDGKYTGIISIEMPDVQLGMRHIIGHSGVNLRKLRNGQAEESDWAKITQAISVTDNEERKRVLINDYTSDWDIIKTQIRTWANNYDMSGGVWIDYLQNLSLNRSGVNDKVREASIISKECKDLAKELKIPIIGLSQLQRTIDEKSDKRPSRANLSWASQFENDADVIILLYRHEVYYPDDDNAKGVAEIIIDKHRNGETAKVYTKYIGERMRFEVVDDASLNLYLQSIDTPKKTGRRREF